MTMVLLMAFRPVGLGDGDRAVDWLRHSGIGESDGAFDGVPSCCMLVLVLVLFMSSTMLMLLIAMVLLMAFPPVVVGAVGGFRHAGVGDSDGAVGGILSCWCWLWYWK